MTMNSEGVSQETTAPQATEVAQPSEVVAPDAPKTPGEAAKEARISAEARARLQRAKEKSDALYRERQAFENEKKQLAEREAKRAEEIATLQKELKELRTGNPLLRAKGEEATAYLREFVDQNTPEARVTALQRALEEQRKELEDKLEQISAANKARDEEETRRRNEVARSQEEGKLHQFTLWVTHPDQAKTYRYLNSEYDQDGVLNLLSQVVAWAKENNKAYPGHEIAAYLEKHAEQVYKKREERRGLYLGATQSATPAVKANDKASPPAQGNGASRNKIQQRHLSKEEEIEADLAILRKAQQADRIANMPKKK